MLAHFSLNDVLALNTYMLGLGTLYSSADGHLLNVFTSSGSDDQDSILLGPILLRFFSDRIVAMDRVHKALESSGLSHRAVNNAIESFVGFGLLPYSVYERPSALSRTGEMYAALMSNPVYIALAAQDTPLPPAVVDRILRGPDLLFSEVDRTLVHFFRYLERVDREMTHRLRARKVQKRIPWPRWSIRSLRSSARKTWQTVVDDSLAEILIEIRDAHVSPLAVGRILHSLAILAGEHAPDLELVRVSDGSFKGMVRGSKTAIDKIKRGLKSAGEAIRRVALTEEYGKVLEANVEKILAEARKIDAEVRRIDVTSAIELGKAMNDVRAGVIRDALEVLAIKKTSQQDVVIAPDGNAGECPTLKGADSEIGN